MCPRCLSHRDIKLPRKILTISEALENPLRREILLQVISRPGISLHKISQELNIGAGNLYNHIAILSRVGLLRIEKRGRRILLFFNDHLLAENILKSLKA